MATSTTPISHQRSASKTIPARPTTPLRPPSRTSLRASQSTPNAPGSAVTGDFPLSSLEPAFAELSDSMADLEANMMHLQLLNESLGRFNENFGAFLYGMNMSAFCVDFPEAPIPQSFARHKDASDQLSNSPFNNRNAPGGADRPDIEATFLTTDTSFVENPPASGISAGKFSAPSSVNRSRPGVGPGRGGSARGAAAGSGVARGSGIARGARPPSGIARGSASRGRASKR